MRRFPRPFSPDNDTAPKNDLGIPEAQATSGPDEALLVPLLVSRCYACDAGTGRGRGSRFACRGPARSRALRLRRALGLLGALAMIAEGVLDGDALHTVFAITERPPSAYVLPRSATVSCVNNASRYIESTG